MKTAVMGLAAAFALVSAITIEEVRLHRGSERIDQLAANRTDYRTLCWEIRDAARDVLARHNERAFAQLDVVARFAGQCGADRERASALAERAGNCFELDHDLICAQQATAEIVDMLPPHYPAFDDEWRLVKPTRLKVSNE